MLKLAVAISALVHTGALAYVVTRPPTPAPKVSPPPPPAIEIVEVTPAPQTSEPAIDVAFLDDATVASARAIDPADLVAPSPAPTHAASHASEHVTTTLPSSTSGTGAGSGEQPAGEGTAHPPGSSRMSMRRPKVDIALPRGTYDDLEHVPAGTNAAPDLTSGRLDPAGGGRYRTNEGVFVANVDRDGTVQFKNAKNLHFNLPVPHVKDIGNGISAWYNDSTKPVGSIGRPTPALDRFALNNDNIESNFNKPDSGGTVPLVGGGFDATDAFMRRHGQDPYASRKLAYLDSTRDERVQIGAKHRQQQLAQATQIMQKNLERMWATVAAPGARKQALFELWDDCAESGTDELVSAGAEARRLVVGFIRARLPVGGPLAYTSDELRGFNARKASRATFAPYD